MLYILTSVKFLHCHVTAGSKWVLAFFLFDYFCIIRIKIVHLKLSVVQESDK